MDWFRWWHGTVTDPKLQRVARMAGATVGEVIAVWACVLERASSVTTSDARVTQGDTPVTRGDVVGFDCGDHDVLLGFADGKTAQIFAALIDRGLIESGRIARWDERQPKREDSSAARTREYRERKKQPAKVTPVTHGDAPEEIREEKSNNPLNPPAEEKPAPKPKAKQKPEPKAASSRSKPKRPLPLPFLITTAMLEWAKEKAPDVNLDWELEQFLDYWKGNGKPMVDWTATWQRWMRTSQARIAQKQPRFGGAVNRQQQIEDANNEVVRQLQRQQGGSGEQDFLREDDPIIEGDFVRES